MEVVDSRVAEEERDEVRDEEGEDAPGLWMDASREKEK